MESEILKPFCLPFRIGMKGYKSEYRKQICYRARKCTVLQACADTFHPGNFTGCGSEGVKDHSKNEAKVVANEVSYTGPWLEVHFHGNMKGTVSEKGSL